MENIEKIIESVATGDVTVEVQKLIDWDIALDLARNTANKAHVCKLPSEKFKYGTLLPEHSPIRAVTFRVVLTNIPYCSSTHLVRHKMGTEHFVGTQRTDRTGRDRKNLSQEAPVKHEMIINANALIFISRRRLCSMASVETRKVWQQVIDKVREIDPAIANCCVPECIYRGFCPEAAGCKYEQTEAYAKRRSDYVSLKGV